MKHMKKALDQMNDKMKEFICIEPDNMTISFRIMGSPTNADCGEFRITSGCQAVDILEYVKNLFQSLNEDFACRENSLTITKIEEALHWQEARKKDRTKRGVEGYMKK